MASRYSRRISKITTSNTVSVLATPMLLSYSLLSLKQVRTQMLSFSMTPQNTECGLLDGSIQYLQGNPLFLISLVMATIYIFPFTLLILLGPLLQAKSHCRLLNWVNKIKLFLDAFDGPYTSRYRYWPGILLSVRLAKFAYYSLGDGHFYFSGCGSASSCLAGDRKDSQSFPPPEKELELLGIVLPHLLFFPSTIPR